MTRWASGAGALSATEGDPRRPPEARSRGSRADRGVRFRSRKAATHPSAVFDSTESGNSDFDPRMEELRTGRRRGADLGRKTGTRGGEPACLEDLYDSLVAPTTKLRKAAILLDRDHEENISALLAVGERLRSSLETKLVAVHVAPSDAVMRGGMTGWDIDPEDPMRPVREWLDGATSGVDLDRVVLSGAEPAEIVAEWAPSAGVDLLVAATASTSLQRAALGSFISRLARKSRVPVLALPNGARASAATSFLERGADVIACVASIDSGSPVVAAAMGVADALPGAGVTFVHAVPARVPIDRGFTRRLFPPSSQSRHEARGRMQALVAAHEGARGVVLIGRARRTTDWIKAEGAGLVVAGSGNPDEPHRLGGFARALCLHTGLHVLLVPEAD